MKRSEMVKVIKDYLDICDQEPQVTHSNQDKAEYILGCCETWGMLPPTFKADSDGEYWKVTHAIAHLNSTGPEWEPEDE